MTLRTVGIVERGPKTVNVKNMRGIGIESTSV